MPLFSHQTPQARKNRSHTQKKNPEPGLNGPARQKPNPKRHRHPAVKLPLSAHKKHPLHEPMQGVFNY
jgi:hypothetical protein